MPDFAWKSNGVETRTGTGILDRETDDSIPRSPTGGNDPGLPPLKITYEEKEASTLEPARSPEEIKSAAEFYAHAGFVFAAAMRLIDEAKEFARRAVEAEDSGDVIAAQDAMLHIKALLPELFACRTLSEGLGTLANSMQCGLENLGTTPVSLDQMRQLRFVFGVLQKEPFLSYEKSLDLVESLQERGFHTYPAWLNHLHDMIDDE